MQMYAATNKQTIESNKEKNPDRIVCIQMYGDFSVWFSGAISNEGIMRQR